MIKLYLFGLKEFFPDVSQEELVEFKWLFEDTLVKIIYY
jgi:hypothetical protein